MFRVKKIHASTLMETLISFLLILIIFSICGSLFINLSKENTNRETNELYPDMNFILNETIKNKVYINRTIKINNNIILVEIEPYYMSKKLLLIEVKGCDDSEKLIGTISRIVLE